MNALSWHDQAPQLHEYLALRAAAGLSAFSPPAAEVGLADSWAAVCVRRDGDLIGMGRIVGDGGCFLQIVDIAVHPSMQRQGLGRAIMQRLIDALVARAPDSAFVSLLADPPGVRLYESFGFRASAPASVGMFRRFHASQGERR
ncbi:GNAT family N-acetyltransferase [Oleiagrimonas sp. C23AA]|uniref:GNAT family N-acetyltransferase n=1 Tax=Oleiagrimonas sp. C23AA TaxID=2719047 RepID=UPI001422D163|nr:GNAT family N-acetyltransferase [Oleiagrimonas sp. C23AA]NII10305.1 GNAT family N-acetyltransferase [Oleiagrimonas sp. C23AA]